MPHKPAVARVQVLIRLDPKEYSAVTRAAKAAGITVPAYVKRAVMERVACRSTEART